MTMFLILFSLLCSGTKFYWNAWANRMILSSHLNRDKVGIFLRVAGSEFEIDGAMKLKYCWLKDFGFRLGILSSFSFKDQGEQDGL